MAATSKPELMTQQASLHPSEHQQGDPLLSVAKAATRGDAEAAATLISQVGGSMLQSIRRILGANHPDLDDVAQEATLSFLKALANFRGESSVAHFANRISMLTALDALRRKTRRERWLVVDHDQTDLVADDRDAPGGLASTTDARRRLLIDLFSDLTPSIGDAMACYFVLGLTAEEIAAAEGVSQNTIWSRIRLGKAALRRRLSQNVDLAEWVRRGE